MSPILTEDEIQDITDRKQPKRQAEVLSQLGIKFKLLAHSNRIKVLRADLVERAADVMRPKLRAIK